MAMIDVPSHYLALAPVAGWPEAAGTKAPLGVLQRIAVRFLTWRAQREAVRLLNRVDSATLRDLGIADVESQVYGDPADRRRGYDRDWWRRK